MIGDGDDKKRERNVHLRLKSISLAACSLGAAWESSMGFWSGHDMNLSCHCRLS